MTKREFRNLTIGDEIVNTMTGRRYRVVKLYPQDDFSHITVWNSNDGSEYAIMRCQSDHHVKVN